MTNLITTIQRCFESVDEAPPPFTRILVLCHNISTLHCVLYMQVILCGCRLIKYNVHCFIARLKSNTFSSFPQSSFHKGETKLETLLAKMQFPFFSFLVATTCIFYFLWNSTPRILGWILGPFPNPAAAFRLQPNLKRRKWNALFWGSQSGEPVSVLLKDQALMHHSFDSSCRLAFAFK